MGAERRTFGELLRHYRRLKYKSLERLADKLGTSKDVLSNYENDKVRPAHDVLLRLIDELDMPPLLLLRAIGYRVDVPADWRDRLMADEALDDELKAAIEVFIQRVRGEGT
jgi:transcriptional regulator with XRE-family HTH domain